MLTVSEVLVQYGMAEQTNSKHHSGQKAETGTISNGQGKKSPIDMSPSDQLSSTGPLVLVHHFKTNASF